MYLKQEIKICDRPTLFTMAQNKSDSTEIKSKQICDSNFINISILFIVAIFSALSF